MEESKRWIVTYTKHLRQKRKVYHDGILEVHGPSNKVLLYDVDEKLLATRILKKDEVIENGANIAFENLLVDIAELESSKTVHHVNSGANQGKSTVKVEGTKNLEGAFPVKQSHQEAVRLPNVCIGPVKTTDREWNVLYTSQVTQKAKKYHDGILKLEASGSYMAQLILLKDDGSTLSSKFHKSSEVFTSGDTCEMPNYLVEICSQRNVLKAIDAFKSNCKPQSSENPSTQLNSHVTVSSHKMKVKNSHQEAGRLQNGCANPVKTTEREWDVLYTSQVTQKAKRYHDGILKLVQSGSHMAQLILLKDDGSTLSSKFHKSCEGVTCGDTCEMPNYLVEICSQRNVLKIADTDSFKINCEPQRSENPPIQLSSSKLKGLDNRIIRKQTSSEVTTKGKVSVDKPCDGSVGDSDNKILRMQSRSEATTKVEVPVYKPRDACQILSVLKKPKEATVVIDLLSSSPLPPRDLNHSTTGQCTRQDLNCQTEIPEGSSSLSVLLTCEENSCETLCVPETEIKGVLKDNLIIEAPQASSVALNSENCGGSRGNGVLELGSGLEESGTYCGSRENGILELENGVNEESGAPDSEKLKDNDKISSEEDEEPERETSSNFPSFDLGF